MEEQKEGTLLKEADPNVKIDTEETPQDEKAKFEELMKKQEQQRLTFAAKKAKHQERHQDPKEMQNFIADKIGGMRKSIQTILNDTPSKENLMKVNDMFDEIDQYYINTSYAMHPYDKKQYKEQIDEVQSKIRVYKRKLKPRKKFRFKSKMKKKSKGQQKTEKVEKVEKVQKLMQKQLQDPVFNIQGLKNLNRISKVIEQDELNDIYKLENLKDCTIELRGTVQTIYIKDLENCKIMMGTIKTSTYITNANNCDFQVMAQQIRIHTSHDTHFRTFCTGDTIIEDCTGLTFSLYNYIYDNLDKDMQEAGFDKKTNLWKNVKDFKWLKQEQSPNFVFQEE